MRAEPVESLSQHFAPGNPIYRRIFLRLPPHIAESFTPEQLAALQSATVARESSHRVVFRQRIPIFGEYRYLAVALGIDRRRKLSALDKFVLHGLRAPAWRRAIFFSVVSVTLLVAVAGVVLLAYAVKSGLGLDLTEGPSVFHNILFASR